MMKCSSVVSSFFVQLLTILITFISTEILASVDEQILDLNENQQIASFEQLKNYVPGDVRCYCNLPACVATGYMCKSEFGGCFSDLVDHEMKSGQHVDVYNARHGCLELLRDREKIVQCKNEPDGKAVLNNPKSLLLCCFKDMCNHVDSPETRTRLNDTLAGSGLNMSSSDHSRGHTSTKNVVAPPSYNDAEVWFKAAIIATPICGVMVLFVLVILAVKILRSDSAHIQAHKLGGYPHHKSHGTCFNQISGHPQCTSSGNMKKINLMQPHHCDTLLIQQNASLLPRNQHDSVTLNVADDRLMLNTESYTNRMLPQATWHHDSESMYSSVHMNEPKCKDGHMKPDHNNVHIDGICDMKNGVDYTCDIDND